MKTEDKLMILKGRIKVLEGTPKNLKCPGVLRKLRRQARNLEKTQSQTQN